MKQIAKWLVAMAATIAAFGAASWVCGELILPAVMKNSGIRWGLAGALGVAVAALAAMWGHSFAATGRPLPCVWRAACWCTYPDAIPDAMRLAVSASCLQDGRSLAAGALALTELPRSGREVRREPVAGRDAREVEALHVGVEMTAGQDNQLLGLVSLVVGGNGQLGRNQVVARGHQQQQRRRADVGHVADRLVLGEHLDAAQRDLVAPGRGAGLARPGEPLPGVRGRQRRCAQRVLVHHRDHGRRLAL